jgi:hypothetical protein
MRILYRNEQFHVKRKIGPVFNDLQIIGDAAVAAFTVEPSSRR